MLRALPQQLILLVLTVFAGSEAVARLGQPTAFAVVAGAAAACAAVGAALVRSSQVGKVTWRNSVAGLLLPWGFLFGAGSLARIAIASGSMTALLGSIGILAGPERLLALAWALDAAALGFLARGFFAQTPGSSARRSLLVPMLIVLGCAVAGFVLLRAGRPQKAALVAGGPVAAVIAGYGLWAIVMVLTFRKARWH